MIGFLDSMTGVFVLVACLWAGVGIVTILERRYPAVLHAPVAAEALLFMAVVGSLGLAIAVARHHPAIALAARLG